MNLKSLYFLFTLIIIPVYIFFTPVKDYIKNFNKLTYSLEIPKNNLPDDYSINDDQIINLDDSFLLEKKITESWVLIFPNINEDTKSNFIDKINGIGISSMIEIKHKNNIIYGIGPFVDKQMAENISLKIMKSTGEKGEAKRLNN
tara:strand:+ start:188 stop:622 length:435 start_codon:yes stop_codon:yes gene_type:complete